MTIVPQVLVPHFIVFWCFYIRYSAQAFGYLGPEVALYSNMLSMSKLYFHISLDEPIKCSAKLFHETLLNEHNHLTQDHFIEPKYDLTCGTFRPQFSCIDQDFAFNLVRFAILHEFKHTGI